MHQYQERDGEEDRQPGGHVKRREEGYVLSRMLDAPVPGKRWGGRQTTRWKDCGKLNRERAKGGGRTGHDNVEERLQLVGEDR